MSSFRKHAKDGTCWSVSHSFRKTRAAGIAPPRKALISLFLFAAIAFASAPVARAQAAPAQDKTGAQVAVKQDGELVVPMRIHLAGTRERPLVIATIGDFPADLGETGKDFLTGEFMESFITETLKLGGPESRQTLKISLLPQNNENERNCSFTIDDLEGHMTVVVMDRRVLIACAFNLSKEDKSPVNLASVGNLFRFHAG